MAARSEKQIGARVDDETLGMVYDAVIALSGPPLRMTKKRLVVEALRREVTRLSKKHNKGKPFPKTDRSLASGASDERPVGKRKAKRVDASSGSRGRPRKKRKVSAAARSRRKSS